jgi:hypothetical protein
MRGHCIVRQKMVDAKCDAPGRAAFSNSSQNVWGMTLFSEATRDAGSDGASPYPELRTTCAGARTIPNRPLLSADRDSLYSVANIPEELSSLINFRPPHASPGFLAARTNHSSPHDGAGNRALTKRVVSRPQPILWPLSTPRPAGMLITGVRPETLDLAPNSFLSSYRSFRFVILRIVFRISPSKSNEHDWMPQLSMASNSSCMALPIEPPRIIVNGPKDPVEIRNCFHLARWWDSIG